MRDRLLLRNSLRWQIGSALGLTLLVVAGMVVGVFATLQTMAHDAALLNEAGRLRMVSQKIAKAAHEASLGVEGAEGELLASVDLFERTLGTVHGSLPEAARAQYAAVDDLWSAYRDAARAVAGGGGDAAGASRVIQASNLDLLREANVGVGMLQAYADGRVSRLRWIVLLGMALAALCSFAVVYVVRRAVTNVTELGAVARHLAAGDFRPVDVASRDEIGLLAGDIRLLAQQVQRRDRALTMLTEASGRIAELPRLVPAMEQVVTLAQTLLGVRRATVYLFDSEGAEAHVVGPASEQARQRCRTARAQAGLLAFEDALAVPLAGSEGVVGVLYACEPQRPFDADDRSFALQIGRLATDAATVKAAQEQRRAERLRIEQVSDELREVLRRVGTGDLTAEPTASTQADGIGEVQDGVRYMIASLRETLGEVVGASQHLAVAVTQIAASAEHLTETSSGQAEGARIMHSSLAELTDTVDANARAAVETAQASERAGQAALEGEAVIERTVEAIRTLSETVGRGARSVETLGASSQQVGDIVQAIAEIAEQTNLLALNAAIEAARAGEHGRGFAVVADEVRRLAERTTEATRQVKSVISSVQQQTEQAVGAMNEGTDRIAEGLVLAERSSATFGQIARTAERTSELVVQIAAATEEQAATASSITASIADVHQHAESGLRETEQTAAAAQQIGGLADRLSALVARFRLAEPAAQPGLTAAAL